MRNPLHLVVETPNGNLVAGMRWFLSACALRFNPRHKRFGHVFSGRYKVLIVEAAASNSHLEQGRGKTLICLRMKFSTPLRSQRHKEDWVWLASLFKLRALRASA